MKRFTETDKWKDPWFRKLSIQMKGFWSYICDNCDIAGIWNTDLELAEFQMGIQLNEEEILRTFSSRIKKLPNGKWIILKFIPFQQGALTVKNNSHIAIIKSLEVNGIDPTSYFAAASEEKKENISDLSEKGVPMGFLPGMEGVATSPGIVKYSTGTSTGKGTGKSKGKGTGKGKEAISEIESIGDDEIPQEVLDEIAAEKELENSSLDPQQSNNDEVKNNRVAGIPIVIPSDIAGVGEPIKPESSNYLFVVIDAYQAAYSKKFNSLYVINGGADAKAMKAYLEAKGNGDEFVKVAVWAWNNLTPEKDNFLYQQSLTVKGLASRFNEIQGRMKTAKKKTYCRDIAI